MTETPQNQPDAESSTPDSADLEALIRSLRRKEGTWVEWGQSCQKLQKAGYSPQQIFEDTGFEPIQQNQVIVAAQVYGTLVSGGAAPEVQAHFERKGSDILYELRILAQADRVTVATLSVERQLDMDEAREVARAAKELSRLPVIPEGFTTHPGDAVAYQVWKLARQKSDLQERSRLIARGLKFAHTPTARQKVESLLTDFTIVKAKPAPRLPIYRLDSEEELPRMIPVAGKLPLSPADYQAVPLLDEAGPFRLVKFSGTGAWIALPGWQALLNAEDPIALLCDSEQLPMPVLSQPEELLVVVDRAQRDWDALSYFIVAVDNQLQLSWFEEAPAVPLLGRLILVMRPKKILDENVSKDMWQIDE